MANKGCPNAGLAEIVRRIFTGPAYTLVAYTNSQGSLGASTILSDLVQPTQANGYAPILLDGVWSFSGGVASYAHSSGASNSNDGNNWPTWYSTGTWSAPATGAAMVYGSIVQHFVDYVDGSGNPIQFVASNGGKWAIDISNLVSGP